MVDLPVYFYRVFADLPSNNNIFIVIHYLHMAVHCMCSHVCTDSIVQCHVYVFMLRGDGNVL